MRRLVERDMAEPGSRELDFSEEEQRACHGEVSRCNRAKWDERLGREPEEVDGDDVQRS